VIACPWCKNGLYLNDHPGLGPCVCVTPERVEALELERDGLQEQLTEAWDKVLENPDVTRDGKSLAEATDEALDLAYHQGAGALGDAADALRDYLVSQGHPATPIRLENPHLDALADALLT
jgi:hypothetical protein